MRSWILAVVAAFGLAFGVPVARAAEVSCPTCVQQAQGGDALAIFLALTKSLPPGAFTYKGSTSLGPTAFEITDITMQEGGPESAVRIKRMFVENIDMMSVLQGGFPTTLKMRLEGVELNDQNTGLDSDVWESLGTREVVGNISIDMASIAATQAFTLSDLTIDLLGIGQMQFKIDMTGASPEGAMMAPEQTMQTATLNSASLMLNDQSFLARSLDSAIKESGQTEAELMALILQELSNNLAGYGGEPGGRLFQAGALIGGWLQDARSPKGPITFSMVPATPVTVEQIDSAESGDQAAEILNLQVSYAGSVATLPEPKEELPIAFVYTDKDSYAVGETVTIFWTETPGNQQDMITVVPEGAPVNEQGANWTYTQGVTDGSYQVAGLTPGNYEIRVYYDYPAGGDVIQATYWFTVAGSSGDQPMQPAGNPTVGTDKPSYKVGDTVVVFWSGLPGNPQDWVTVVPVGAPADEFGTWTYTNGQATGAYQVTDLTAGDYEVRAFYDYPNGGSEVHAIATFSVAP